MTGYSLFRRRAKFLLSMWRVRFMSRPHLLLGDLFVTTRCNGQCRYCYVDKSIPRSAEMTTAQWISVIDDAIDHGCRMFNLMGGEPLLREDCGELLAHIDRRGILCDLNTNCFLLPERLADVKLACQVFTSLDGGPAAHDANRGTGSFAKTAAGIECALGAGIPVRINCTVTNNNRGEIDFLCRYATERKLYLTFTPLIRIRDNLQHAAADIHLSDEDARNFFRQVKVAKSHCKYIMNSDHMLDYFINYPLPFGKMVCRDECDERLLNYYRHHCPYGRWQFFIASNGDMFPCHNIWNDTSFTPPNALREGVSAAVNLTADQLKCRYCWLANLVEWNDFFSPHWLVKGMLMTLDQMFCR